MKIIQVFNRYRTGFGGEYIVIDSIRRLMMDRGHKVQLAERNSSAIRTLEDKFSAFWSGIYSHGAKKQMAALLKEERPDVVHIHNLYPLFSPSILVSCRKLGFPVVMTVHNFGLTCPVGLHFYRGRICTECLGGNEYWCIIRNCTENVLKSFNYCLRTAVARKLGLYKDNVTTFISLTSFMKNWLIRNGYPENRIVVVPNSVPIPDMSLNASNGEYVLFVGRIEKIKGIETLVSASKLTPEVPYLVVGDGPAKKEIAMCSPRHVSFAGYIDRIKLQFFYRRARLVVVPSLCLEAFPLVLIEAMSHGVPVIASRTGSLSEVVDDGVNGLLFEPGNARDLAEKIAYFWNKPSKCREMGGAGREKVAKEYSEDVYYDRLMAVYMNTIERNREGLKWS